MANRISAPTVWYLAYGSNLSSAKFTGSRGIIPLATARVRIPGWTLAFNIPGVPYSEPSFTSIIPSDTATPNSAGSIPDILGIIYLITAKQYIHVLASEGGGIAYDDIEVEAVPVGERDAEIMGGQKVMVKTLGAAMERRPWPRPSRRYMDIILAGSLEMDLPQKYHQFLASQPVYETPSNRRGKIGAMIFLAFWGPVMGWMEKITNATMGNDGYAPRWVVWLVRFVVWMVWVSHDAFFAPLCGRGDGCSIDETFKIVPVKRSDADLEKQPLL